MPIFQGETSTENPKELEVKPFEPGHRIYLYLSEATHLFGEGFKVELGGEVEARVDLLRLEGVQVHLEAVQVQHHVRRKLPQNGPLVDGNVFPLQKI